MRIDEISNQNKFILSLHNIKFEFKSRFKIIESDFILFYQSKNTYALHDLLEKEINLEIEKVNAFLSNLDILYNDLETRQSINEIRGIRSSLLRMSNQIMKMK